MEVKNINKNLTVFTETCPILCKDGGIRIVMMGCVVSRHEEDVPLGVDTNVQTDDPSVVGVINLYTRVKVSNVAIAYAITHPEEVGGFSQEKGVKIILQRAETMPLATFSTSSKFFLTRSLISAILNDKLSSFVKHIDEIVPHEKSL